MKTFFILLLLTGAAVGGGWWYLQKQKSSEAVIYVTAPVIRGDITQSVTATGTINPVVNVEVGSQISGNIQKLFADFNTPVKAGQVVAQLDPATYQASFNQAKGELANAEANLELARITAKRKKELVSQMAAPQADLDTANGALAQAEAQLQIRSAQLEKAKVDLSRCTIYSPVDGTVITRSVDVGQTVAASMSAPVLFLIANDLTKMQINTAVAEADVGHVEEGQAVEFTVDAFPDRTFYGKVFQVRNAATTVENVVTYDVVIEVKNDDLKLRPGMTANVSIIIKQAKDSIRIPNAALRYKPPVNGDKPEGQDRGRGGPRGGGGDGERRGGSGRRGGEEGEGGTAAQLPADDSPKQQTVYVLKDGAPVATQVTTGITDNIGTAVLDGLKEGDQVITGQTGGSPAGASANAGQGSNPFAPRRF